MTKDYPYIGVPVIGDWTSRLGMIRQILTQPCGPDPGIWVQAFFSAIPTMLATILAPSPTDYLLIRRGAGAPFHGQRRRLQFDIYNVIELAAPKQPTLDWFFFPVSALLNKLAQLEWWFTIIDATLDGAVMWTSLAYKWAGCPGLTHPYAYATCGPGTPWVGPYTVFGNPHYQIMTIALADLVIPGGLVAQQSFSLNFGTNPFYHEDGGGASLALYSGHYNKNIGTAFPVQQEDGTWNTHLVVPPYRVVSSGDVYNIIKLSADPKCWCTSGFWSASASDPTESPVGLKHWSPKPPGRGEVEH